MTWQLRRALDIDVQDLWALLTIPDVYRYLCDGEPPPLSHVNAWVAFKDPRQRAFGFGFWLLENESHDLCGFVGLGPDPRPNTGELVYGLHPRCWGQGLATRMGWTVMKRAFEDDGLDQVIAGADEPNSASIAVMKRLGMTYLQRVQYPLGPGVEYALKSSDSRPSISTIRQVR